VRRRIRKRLVKALGSTEELRGELRILRQVWVAGTVGGAVKCVDIYWNADGEDEQLGLS
jgi:hypothetical protein